MNPLSERTFKPWVLPSCGGPRWHGGKDDPSGGGTQSEMEITWRGREEGYPEIPPCRPLGTSEKIGATGTVALVISGPMASETDIPTFRHQKLRDATWVPSLPDTWQPTSRRIPLEVFAGSSPRLYSISQQRWVGKENSPSNFIRTSFRALGPDISLHFL